MTTLRRLTVVATGSCCSFLRLPIRSQRSDNLPRLWEYVIGEASWRSDRYFAV